MKVNLNIKGMHCKSCVKLVEMEFDGKVNDIKVEENGKASIDFDEKKINLAKIKEMITKLGYQA